MMKTPALVTSAMLSMYPLNQMAARTVRPSMAHHVDTLPACVEPVQRQPQVRLARCRPLLSHRAENSLSLESVAEATNA